MDAKKNTDEPRMDQPSREAMAGKLQIYAGRAGAVMGQGRESCDTRGALPRLRGRRGGHRGRDLAACGRSGFTNDSIAPSALNAFLNAYLGLRFALP
jgi:hypothetical protein